MEHNILKAAAKNREVFNKLELLEAHSYLSDSSKIIYKAIKDYYEADGSVNSVDLDIVYTRIIRKHPRQEDVFKTIFGFLTDGEDVSGINIVAECIASQKQYVGLELSTALLEGSSKVDELIQSYIDIEKNILAITDSKENEFHAVEVSELFSPTVRDNKIKLLPLALNERLDGGIEGGDNLLVFARPEVGKSLFSINAACGFVVQGYRCLYYGNEDAPQRILRRVVQRLSGRTYGEVEVNPRDAQERANRRGYELFHFVRGTALTYGELRAKIESIEPQVLVVDQLRHMVTGNDNMVQRLEEAANASRKIASEYNIPVLNVTQAGDSAEGKLVLNQGDVDSSNTGIPGAMDVMIGIGANEQYLARSMRRISLPKNKLGNDHGNFDIMVNEALSKIVE